MKKLFSVVVVFFITIVMLGCDKGSPEYQAALATKKEQQREEKEANKARVQRKKQYERARVEMLKRGTAVLEIFEDEADDMTTQQLKDLADACRGRASMEYCRKKGMGEYSDLLIRGVGKFIHVGFPYIPENEVQPKYQISMTDRWIETSEYVFFLSRKRTEKDSWNEVEEILIQHGVPKDQIFRINAITNRDLLKQLPLW